jgi:hypothetical protein
MTKQFEEIMGILTLVEEVAVKIKADLEDDGRISLVEFVELIFSEATEAIALALHAGDVVADQMTEDEVLTVLQKLVEVGKTLASIFVK